MRHKKDNSQTYLDLTLNGFPCITKDEDHSLSYSRWKMHSLHWTMKTKTENKQTHPSCIHSIRKIDKSIGHIV